MRSARFVRLVTAATLLAFLTVPVRPALAAPEDEGAPARVATQPSSLRQSIDQAGTRAAAQFPRVPDRPATPVRKQMMGGGGGGGMMMMTLLVTAASLAGTYFLVKEMKKSNDEAKTAQ